MPGLGLQGGFGAGGAVDALRVLIAEAQRKQHEENQVAAEQAALEENRRQFNARLPLEERRVKLSELQIPAEVKKTEAETQNVIGRYPHEEKMQGANFAHDVSMQANLFGQQDKTQQDDYRRKLDLANLMQMNELARQQQASTLNISEIQERGRQERETNRTAPARTYAPQAVWTDSGLGLLNKSTGTVTPVQGQGGTGQVKPQATAGMREREDARTNASKGVVAIKDLSDQLITERGVAQRVKATGMSVESALGANPKYRAYQDARMALAGNLAVLQQGSRPSDADIKSIWLPLVPDVFNDTDESAGLKWGLINTMSGFKPQGGGAEPAAPAAATGGVQFDYVPGKGIVRRGGG